MIENIFKDIKIDKENEQFFDLIKKDDIRIEKIVSNGQVSPKDFWYSQDENEFVIVLKGEAILEFENCDDIRLKEGDYLNIPAHTKHRVSWTKENEETIWLAIHY